jgi:hypothetical protein
MQRILAVFVLVLIHAPIGAAAGPDAAWTIVLHPKDFVIGAALGELRTRHNWASGFDERSGGFDVALRKSAVAIPAPRCRMDYLILKIPFYYPENPKQASVSERRAVYDALVALQANGGGSITVRVEAPEGIGRTAAGRTELAACNLYFALPLSVTPAPH